MTFETILPALDIIIALGAVFGIGLAALKWVVPAGVRVHAALKKVDTIYAEVKPNGGSSLRDSMDRQESALAVVRDGLEMADARAWAIVSAGKLPTWECGSDGQCVMANAAYLELVGRTAEDVKGNGWENILTESDKPRIWKEWANAVEKRRTFECTYHITNHVTGLNYVVDGKATPILDRTGGLRGWIGVYNNVRLVEPVPQDTGRLQKAP